ncbi:MAG TPA: serine O-acetyltransferase [Sedimentisphaerales bacterium]|jgi:serine O-acetyltransferase|nr:serine O-acetyltransferase [Sedimentisphaerales bacterium]HNU28005.1 serine O-acetyltransferase [Sedimentisphaerales bacterium]
MTKDRLTNKTLDRLVDEITETYDGDLGINFIDASNLPVRGKIIEVLDLLIELLFPGHTGSKAITRSNVRYIVGDLLSQVYTELAEQVERAYQYQCRINNCTHCDCGTMARKVTSELLGEVPRIRGVLKTDVRAAYEGDPAATSYEEIVMSYPCIIAIATYRVAHELYVRQVPLIPRIMSECAHMKTGIDIHPGATIGSGFFIDHGTGVVIGETSVIGNNVKIYQGTTLGALSFRRDERGRIIKGGKRHPTIEDDVTIYAEATILGDVTIGKGAVIGGNTWVKESVPPGVTVSSPGADLVYRKQKTAGQKNT